MVTMKAISEEKLAKFVEQKLRLVGEHLLETGRLADALNHSLTQTASELTELKNALRNGQFQLPLGL